MLEERERGQTESLQRLKRIASRILFGIAACVALALLSLKETRDFLRSLLQDEPAKSQAAATPATPAKVDEEALKKVADMVSQANGGKTIDKGDIEFGMELLNFMQTPSKDNGAAAKAADGKK